MSRANGEFYIEKPDEVMCTIKLTLPLSDWVKVRDCLAQSKTPVQWPVSLLRDTISELVGKAKKSFVEIENIT